MANNYGNYQGDGPHLGYLVAGGDVYSFDLPQADAKALTTEHGRYRLDPRSLLGSDGLSLITSAANKGIGYRASLPLVRNVPYLSTAVSRHHLGHSKVMLLHSGNHSFLEPKTDTPKTLAEVSYLDITTHAENPTNLENANLKDDLNDVLRLSKNAFNHAKHEYQTALGEYRRVQQNSPSSFPRKKQSLLDRVAKAHSHLCLTKKALEDTLATRYDDSNLPKYEATFDERECKSAREALYSTEIENIHLTHVGCKIGTENRLRNTVLLARNAWEKFNSVDEEITNGALRFATDEEKENLRFALVTDVEKAFAADPTLERPLIGSPAHNNFLALKARIGKMKDADFTATLRSYFFDKETKELPEAFTRRLSTEQRRFANAVMKAKNNQLSRQELLSSIGHGITSVAEFLRFMPSMKRTASVQSDADALKSLAQDVHSLSLSTALRRPRESYVKQVLSPAQSFGAGTLTWAENSAEMHYANIYNILNDIALHPLIEELRSAIEAVENDRPDPAVVARIKAAKTKIDDFHAAHGNYANDLDEAFRELTTLSGNKMYKGILGDLSLVSRRYNESRKLMDSYESIMDFAELLTAADPVTLLATKKAAVDKASFPQKANLLGKFMVCKANMLATKIDSKATVTSQGGLLGYGATNTWDFNKGEFAQLETHLRAFRAALPASPAEIDAQTQAFLKELVDLRNAYDPFANDPKMLLGEHRDRYIAFNGALQTVVRDVADLTNQTIRTIESAAADAHTAATTLTTPQSLRNATALIQAAVGQLEGLAEKYPGRAAQLAAQLAEDANLVVAFAHNVITTRAGLAQNNKTGLSKEADKLVIAATTAYQIAERAATKTDTAEAASDAARASALNTADNAAIIKQAAGL